MIFGHSPGFFPLGLLLVVDGKGVQLYVWIRISAAWMDLELILTFRVDMFGLDSSDLWAFPRLQPSLQSPSSKPRGLRG